MTSKRIRIDVEDKDGAKFDFKIEGNVTREKVLKMFEFMELMNIEEPGKDTKTDTIGGKYGIWLTSTIQQAVSHQPRYWRDMKMSSTNPSNLV